MPSSRRQNEVPEFGGARRHLELPTECPVPRHPLQNVPPHPLQFRRWNVIRYPAVDDRRPLDTEVEFPDQGSAVIGLNPLFYRYQLHPLAAQGAVDLPLASAHVHLALGVD